MISYAQTGEDVLLARVFPKDHKGFYIDAGANHPVNNNVTKHFYEHGWHGINIEPVTHLAAALQADRPRDVTLNVGLSNESGTLKFYRLLPNLHKDSHELSCFDPLVAAAMEKSGHQVVTDEIPVLTLRAVCEKHVSGPIDFLKIDVEGHERLALEGADLRRFRPRVILVEDGAYHPRSDWEPFILQADYQEATWDGINRYYVGLGDQEALDRLRTPVNVLDDYIPYRYLVAMETANRHQALVRNLAAQIEAVRVTLDVVGRGQGDGNVLAAQLQSLRAALDAAESMQPDFAQTTVARQIVADIGGTAARHLQRAALWVRRHPALLRLGKRVVRQLPRGKAGNA